MTKRRVSVVGLGHMGSAIASRLIDSGYKVSVWNRSPLRTFDFADSAAVAATASEAIEYGELTIISALDNHASRLILESAAGILPGALIVNLSSDTPRTSSKLAEWAIERGVRYVSGVMLTPSTAVGHETSTMLLAGAPADLDTCLAILRDIAPRLTVLGPDHALPPSFDAALLDVFWTTLAAWTHGVALAEAHGIRGGDISQPLSDIVRLAAEIGPTFSRDGDRQSYDATTSTIRSATRTMEHVLEAATDAGIDLTLPRAVTTLYEAASKGHDHDAPSRVIEAIRSRRGSVRENVPNRGV